MEVDFDFKRHPAHVHRLVDLHEYFYLLTAKHAAFYLPKAWKTRAAGKRYNPAESNPSGQNQTLLLWLSRTLTRRLTTQLHLLTLQSFH